MRWPFGPPHLTLKPSKENPKEKKKTIKTKKKQKTQKIPKKEFFSYQSNFFFGAVSKNCLLWQLGPENAHPQNTIKIGVSAYFLEKKICVTKRPFLDQKNPNPEIPVIFLFFAFFLFQQQKNTKISWNPYFYSVLKNLKKEIFQILNLKHRKLRNPIFAPFFEKGYF